jgi:hypothetical protein
MRVKSSYLNLIAGGILGNDRAVRKCYLDMARLIRRGASEYDKNYYDSGFSEFERTLFFSLRNHCDLIKDNLVGIQKMDTSSVREIVKTYFPGYKQILRRTRLLVREDDR